MRTNFDWKVSCERFGKGCRRIMWLKLYTCRSAAMSAAKKRLQLPGLGSRNRRAPAPVFVEADQIFDRLSQSDDGGDPQAEWSPLIDSICHVLRIGTGDGVRRGNNPGAGKH